MPPLVPATVRASVPLLVIGEPATLISPPVKDCATLVTVPEPPPPPPPPPVDAIVTVPESAVIVMFDPAVSTRDPGSSGSALVVTRLIACTPGVEVTTSLTL